MPRAHEADGVTVDELIAAAAHFRDDRDRWIRLFNRLQGAVQHHKNAYSAAGFAADLPDEALWSAMDRVLKDAAEGSDSGRTR